MAATTAAPIRPDLQARFEVDDDAPRPPEAHPLPRWPLQAGPLDSAQARRAIRDLDNRNQ